MKIKDKVKYNLKLIEVEFFHNNYEYEYYIRISDGFIIKEEVEYKAIITDNNPISITKARELALRLVKGPSNNDIKIIKEDKEDNRLVYEGLIIYGDYKYEFEIDAKSGIFLEWQKEYLYK